MTKYVERVSNLIRVTSHVQDNKFDLGMWWNPLTGCGCAVGHAMHDSYFVMEGIPGNKFFPCIDDLATFFDISNCKAITLFTSSSGYRTRQDVLSALRVLLMEKEAEAMASDAHGTVEFLAEDVREDIAAW